MPALIEVRDLTKDYRLTRRRAGVLGGLVDLVRPRKRILRAVDRVSFTIAAGEMVGYIGANGAGKSTTIKMLTGILTPTGGEVRVGGLVPYRQRQQYTRHIGVVFGQRTQLWWDLAVLESFRLLKKIYEVDDATYARQMKLFDQLLGIGDLLDQPVRKLSLGQRMRCDLAAALLHRPTILFLDEPTIGLDVVAKENVRSFLREARDRLGTTVILTTHDLGDIQQLCRRIIIIDRGIVLYDGLLEDLRQHLGHRVRLHLELREQVPTSALARLTDPLPVVWSDGDDRKHTAEFSRLEVTSAEVIQRVIAEYAVQDLHTSEPDIEEVVRRIYRDRDVLSLPAAQRSDGAAAALMDARLDADAQAADAGREASRG
jgi:ABC-2 type transport system ATP-binding protein